MTARSTSAARSSPRRRCVEAELTDLDKAWLTRKLTQYGLMPDKGVDHFTKIVAGKQLWNYDNLEPNEKKLIL